MGYVQLVSMRGDLMVNHYYRSFDGSYSDKAFIPCRCDQCKTNTHNSVIDSLKTDAAIPGYLKDVI